MLAPILWGGQLRTEASTTAAKPATLTLTDSPQTDARARAFVLAGELDARGAVVLAKRVRKRLPAK